MWFLWQIFILLANRAVLDEFLSISSQIGPVKGRGYLCHSGIQTRMSPDWGVVKFLDNEVEEVMG